MPRRRRPPASRAGAGLCWLALLSLTLPGVPAGATSSRVRSLGGGGDYLEDLDNVLRWYGSLASYRDLALLELGRLVEDDPTIGSSPRAHEQGIGAHVQLAADGGLGVVGLYLSADGESGRRPAGRVLMYGRAWPRWQAALLLGLTHASAEGEGTSERAVDTVLGVGARWELGEAAFLDLAGDWRLSARRQRLDVLTLDERDQGSFGVRSRLFWSPRPSLFLVPVCGYARDDFWELGVGALPPRRLDAWQWRGGLGLLLLPDDDLLASLVAELRIGRWRRDDPFAPSDGSSANPAARFQEVALRMGLEARVRSWLTLRGGAVSAPGGHRRADDPYWERSDPFQLTLGLGLHLGPLDADLLLDQNAPFNFGSLLTNAGGVESSTFSSISIIYAF